MTRYDSINVIRRCIEDARAISPDICVDFYVADELHKFIQVFDCAINAICPSDCNPKQCESWLTSMTGSVRVFDWNGQGSAGFEYSNLDPEDLVAWLDRYFVEILGCNREGYLLDVSYVDFGRSDEPGSSAETFYNTGRVGILEDKTIVMPAGGWSDTVGIWDGQISVKPSDRYYELWHWIIQDGRWSHEDCKIKDSDMLKIEAEFLVLKDGEQQASPLKSGTPTLFVHLSRMISSQTGLEYRL
jgi:hypothetical protein